MSTANGGSLDDCITNLFALTELNGLQWRQYECPSWTVDANPRTLLQSEPILVAYSKLQSDGILCVWRRTKKPLPTVVTGRPTIDSTASKELWVFWYGATEPEEIEEHCKDLVKKKNDDDPEDGTVTAIPYDVRCLLYKAWNTQMEKHYRRKKFVQVGRWFIRPLRVLDPSTAFMLDDFVLAHTHSFNIVGGNSMCMAIKTQLQPNLVHLSPFHVERNRKNKETRVNVILAPWSLNAHISFKYAIMPLSKKEEEEVEKQLTQWKELNMFVDLKKKKKRRREEGGETEGDESEDEGWGETKMPKMIRVEVNGKIRMWWPTQYVLVTLEETRRLVRNRFPVSDHLKCVPERETKYSRNRFRNLTSSEGSLRISQAAADNVNFRKKTTYPDMLPNVLMHRVPSVDKDPIVVHPKRKYSDRKKRRKRKIVSYEERTRRKLEKETGTARVYRVSSVTSDDGEDEWTEPNLKKDLKRLMVPSRFNCRARNGRRQTKKDTAMLSMGLTSSEDDEEPENPKKEVIEEKEGREWKNGNEDCGSTARDLNNQPTQAVYHYGSNKGPSLRRKKNDESAVEARMDRAPFAPVRALTPLTSQMEAEERETMVQLIKKQLLEDASAKKESSAPFRSDLSISAFLREYGSYYDVKAAETMPDIKYKSYHSRRNGPRKQSEGGQRNKVDGRSIDELVICSSDEDCLGEMHECKRVREITPDPVRPIRSFVAPNWEREEVGGVNIPPVLKLDPDMVVRPKRSRFHPEKHQSIEFPELEACDDAMELDILQQLEQPGFDYGSDEEPSDDRYSIGSDLQPPFSVAPMDDAGEGTSSGAENWPRDEDEEMNEEYHHMDSSNELMDTDGPPHSDSVLSPPASNERADSNNSMYPRLPGGPHSVGDTALNRIYPTPPSLLQVDICSPAMMGGPHSQARKEDRDDGSSSHSDDDEIMKFVDEIDLKDEDMARGDHKITHLHSILVSRHFFDNSPKTDVPVSFRFGPYKERRRVAKKEELFVYNKKDGERKEQLPPHIADALDGANNFTTLSRRTTPSTSSTSNASNTGGAQHWQPPHQQQPMTQSSMLAHHQMQQMQQQQQHQSQPGPSMAPPSQPHPMQPTMQQHPAYMAGTVPPGQMGAFPGQAGMRPGYNPQAYGVAIQQQMQQQQQGFPGQQQPQYPMGGVGGQMMMGGQPGQPGYHPGQMRPPGYPQQYPGQPGVNPMGGVHPMQAQGMQTHQMGAYQQGMQNQMMYRQGMQQGSYPPQFGSPMGGMMAPPNAMAGMAQMGQYPGGQMQQPGMMMQQMQHGQPMIAGAPHPMGMPGGGMVSHPSFPMPAVSAAAASVPPPSASSSVVCVGTKSAEKKPRTPGALIDEEQTLIASRRGEDPYVHSLTIAPKGLFHKGNRQLKNEFDLYVTELILAKERKKEKRLFGPPTSGSEGLSIVVAVMLQDTILNLHFDWVFDSCPICACTTSIRSRELGVYITPPSVLEEPVEVQNVWIGPWHGMHADSNDSSCICGFSVIRHRLLSMRSGLFIEDSYEATGHDNSGTNPPKETRDNETTKSLWFDPSSPTDHSLVETLRSMALTTDLGRLVAAVRNISTMRSTKEMRKGRRGRRKRKKEKMPTISTIGHPTEYVVSQLDKMELRIMGSSALLSAHTTGNKPSMAKSPYFHPWGLQIASEVADPTEMEIKNLLEDVKPLIEGAVREARKLSSSTASSSVIEGPLTWRSLAAKNVKCSGNGDDDSHIAEPIPQIELATEKDATRIAPTVMKNWEQHNLGPIDVPKDVLYLAVVPDDDKVYDMTVVYMRRLSKMYEQNLRLGRHAGYLARDEPMRTPVREGIVRASTARSQYAYDVQSSSSGSPSLLFVREIEKEAQKYGCGKEFIHKLMSYIQCMEDVLIEHLEKSCRIFDRDVFRECVAYNLYHRRMNQKQKSNNQAATKHERDTDEGSPAAGDVEMRREEGEKRKESQMFRGPLAEAMGMTGGSSSSNLKAKKKAKRPYGQAPPYGMEGERLFKHLPEEEPAALPQIVVIYLSMWPCFGSDGRDGEAARVAMIAIVKSFNAVMKRLPLKYRGQCQLELIPIQRLQESVGHGADLDRLDRSSNLNTWQIGNMHRSAEIYPNDRPKIEDVLKEIAFGIYRKPRFIHCEALKNSLPKSMTKFGPASAILDWIDKKDGKKMTMYKCQSVPFQLANTPAIIAKNEAKFSQLCMDEVSLYISYCLVSTQFIVVTVTDNLGARVDSSVLNLNPTHEQSGNTFRSKHNKSSVRDGLTKLWQFIEGVMLNESKPLRLVIGKLGKMGHGEFKAWCYFLNRNHLKRYSSRVRESCSPCNANAGAPVLLSACLVSTEPEAHLQVLPSFSIPPDPNGMTKKIRPLHTPGDNTITHIMVFPVSPAIQLTQSTEMGGVDDDNDDFGDLDVPDIGLGGDEMNDIMNDIMMDGGGEGRAAPRNAHANSIFETQLDSGVQNQPLAAGWMISTAPGGDLPDWFWSSCPSLKRRLPVHLRSSLHINESQLSRSDDIMKKEKEQEISHALDSQKTDEVLRHVLEQYNDLSWLAIDSITQERRSCLPIHIQALTRLHDTVLNLIL